MPETTESQGLAQSIAQPLDAVKLPLWGSRLIEASAGTGKTWTIAALYLRLVLGHGATGTSFARPLLPSEILVMTFTRAATRELSDRIRARLIDAARCFRGEKDVDADDSFLLSLLKDYPLDKDRNTAAWRLAMAADAMDEASVHTIDAWCQRMLREHAFDSGCLFDEELVVDEAALLEEAVQDYWRRELYPLSQAMLAQIMEVWKDLEACTKDIAQLLHADLVTDHVRRLDEALDDWAAPCAGLLLDRREQVDAMCRWLEQQLRENRQHWNGNKMRPATVAIWLSQLRRWALLDLPITPPFDPGDRGLKALTPSGLDAARNAAAPKITMPQCFFWFEEIVAAYQAAGSASSVLRLHAAAQVSLRLAQLKQHSGQFGFSDMLQRLDVALVSGNGLHLRTRILTQYPVALIDEFQDTSPVQYRIFDQIYQTQVNSPNSSLLLIGDPKQSIYGFRGADIYSYLQASYATAGRHYALGVNYRSTEAMVDSVNHCFMQAEESSETGAFQFKSISSGNPLPFVQVLARGREESWVGGAEETSMPAITIVHDPNLQSNKSIRRRYSERCAEQIAQWLNDRKNGFSHPEKGFERLRPRDIAVLVRTGKEAAAVRRALQRRNVASVYLSDKDSVFQSDEARDLLHWLCAVAAPQDATLVRAALALSTIGLSLTTLNQLASDDEAFDSQVQRMRDLREIWKGQGVLAMLRQTLHVFQLAAGWFQQQGGERRLTNFLHLAELLQTASGELEGEQAVIRWLTNQIAEDADQNEEQVVRLESDADLVKVITVHKSKGMEYPVVCLPFATTCRMVERKYAKSVLLPDDGGGRELFLELDDETLERAEKERLREDLRLLYVAMTRARHALWLGFAAVKVGNGKSCQTHKSALGCLVGDGQPLAPEAWQVPLSKLAEGYDGIRLVMAEEVTPQTTFLLDASVATLRKQQPYVGKFRLQWGIASYSRLTRDLKSPGSELQPLQSMRPADDELQGDSGIESDLPATDDQTVAGTRIQHGFKRGALTGNFLHDQLEWLAGERFALQDNPALTARLRGRCERAGHEEHAEGLANWLQAIVQTTLPGPDVTLSGLKTARAELEFWLPMQLLQTKGVDALCRLHFMPGVERPTLQSSALHGMLMGFVDLVFEHQGRYWVLDYKSNHLGDGDSAYTHEALSKAMASHRYDVQAAIYLLALHRLLQARLGDKYDPDKQLGGAVYLFLRGIHGPAQGVCQLNATAEFLEQMENLLDPVLETNP